MKTCPLCGHQNPDENKFCTYCGNALNAEADPNKDPDAAIVEVKAEEKPTEDVKPAPSQEAPQPQNAADSGWKVADTYAIIALATAIDGLPVVPIVFGYLGRESKRLPGLAKAGLIVGIIGTSLWALYITLALILIPLGLWPWTNV
jgi:hypothetical protein